MDWISATDELPGNESAVLGVVRCRFLDHSYVTIVYYQYGPRTWKRLKGDGPVNVSHWQPLPKPPQS
jgi:hypothetical protein